MASCVNKAIAFFLVVRSYQNGHLVLCLQIGGNGVTIITQLLELHEHIFSKQTAGPHKATELTVICP